MTFQLFFDSDPFSGIEEDGNAFSVTYLFGIDREEGTSFFMTVAFDFQPTLVHEFKFFVTRREVATAHENHFWGGAVSSFRATQEQRIIIRHSVLAATEILLSFRAPQEVVMVTRQADLPPRALEKYELLSNVFVTRGYRAVTETAYGYKKLWRFHLPEAERSTGHE